MADKPNTPTPAASSATGKDEFDRVGLENMLKQRFFFTPAFSIYGGVRGLYDYGPPGCAVKNNLLALWRQHFVLEESMLEIESTSLTPEIVLKTSGHVDKFQDMMVKDTVTGECYRADHLLEETIEKYLETHPNLTAAQRAEAESDLDGADALSPEELHIKLQKYKAVYPESGNPISAPFFFNLMFDTQIGPTGKFKGFLRPETAQGIFVNFKKLLEANSSRLPFAAAQVGPAFRNEISPRSGLLRVREFTLAEIEHFVDPKDKSHPKFRDVASLSMRLFPAVNQLGDKKIQDMTIGEAVSKSIVANETLGYFLARIHMFLMKVGINPAKLRFRQHLPKQMAHYACDCWDAEIQTSYGWIECVGCADRSAYDLTVHQMISGEKLTAWADFKDGAHELDVWQLDVNKGAIGKAYRETAKKALSHLDQIKEEWDKISELKSTLEKDGHLEIEGIKLTPDMLKFKAVKKRLLGRSFVPGVIEPSFGIGRILYCIFEHSYYVRAGSEKRGVLSFKPAIAPTKVSILPVSNSDKFTAHIPRITKLLTAAGISSKPDDSGVSLGRKYARTDEIGIPFGITVYGDTLDRDVVTLRERDSTHQVVVPVAELPAVLNALISGEKSWETVKTKYPIYETKADE